MEYGQGHREMARHTETGCGRGRAGGPEVREGPAGKESERREPRAGSRADGGKRQEAEPKAER